MTEAARIGTNLDRVLHYRRYADGSASAGDPVPFPVGVEAGGFEYNLYMAFAFQSASRYGKRARVRAGRLGVSGGESR